MFLESKGNFSLIEPLAHAILESDAIRETGLTRFPGTLEESPGPPILRNPVPSLFPAGKDEQEFLQVLSKGLILVRQSTSFGSMRLYRRGISRWGGT